MKTHLWRIGAAAAAAVLLFSGLIASVYGAEPTVTRTVRVGWDPVRGVHDGNSADTMGGYEYEYLIRIAQLAHWDYQFVYGDFEDLEQQLRDGTIDMMGDLGYLEEREAYYDYCDYPDGYNRMLILGQADDDRYTYDDFTGFDGAVIGTLASSFRENMLREEAEESGVTVSIQPFDSMEDAFSALDGGTVDAVITSNLKLDKPYKVLYEWPHISTYFAVSKKQPEILAQLNHAMREIQSIDPYMQERLYKKYFDQGDSSAMVALDRAELDYVSQSSAFTVLLAADQAPLSYWENGTAKGVIPDYLSVISEKTGLTFRYEACDTYKDLVRRFFDGEGDMAGQFYDYIDPHQPAAFQRTQPYLTINYGLIYRNSGSISPDGRVAVMNGDDLTARRLKTMGMTPVFYPSPAACLNAVTGRQAEAAALPTLLYEHLGYHAAYAGLTLKLQPQLSTGLCLSVCNSDGQNALLQNILLKAVSSVSQDTVDALVRTNSLQERSYTFTDRLYSNRTWVTVVTALLATMFFLILWFSRQHRYSSALRKANAELLAANEQIRRDTDAKAMLFSDISHDMRTPLNSVIGFAELAEQEAVSPQVRDYLAKIKVSGKLLLQLVNDTLTVFKLNSGKLELKCQPISTLEVAEAIIVPISAAAERKNVTFIADFSQLHGRMVMADKLNLQKIFLNLLANAVKFTPAGGHVFYTVKDDPENGSDPDIVVIVRDDGIGMSKEYQERLYEPFHQERRAGYDAVGTGLGLSIVKHLVDLMDGTIEVESEKDQGTVFTLRFHFDPASAALLPPSAPRPPLQTLQRKRILLCEDILLNREIACAMLRAKGMDVVTAENGQLGLDAFRESKAGFFDAVLMDLRMPVMDGFAATAAIRALPRPDAAVIPIIAMTADAFAEDIERCLRSGMNAHIAKPVDPALLYAVMAQQLQNTQEGGSQDAIF